MPTQYTRATMAERRFRAAGILVVGLLCALTGACASRGLPHPSESAVVVYDPQQLDVPAWWHHHTECVLLEPSHRRAPTAAVRDALAKYPLSVLAEMGRVLLVKRFRFRSDGDRFDLVGGTFVGRNIIIAADSAGTEGILHREFASILREHHGKHVDEAAWRRANPPEFRYLGSSHAAVKAGRTSLRGAHAWYARGFTSEYSTASLDNDFSNVTEALFLGDPVIWNPLYPRLCDKRRLATGFYQRLDPSLSTRYFYDLHLARMNELGLDPYPPEQENIGPP